MKQNNAENTLKRLAKEQGVSVETVRAEIQLAIDQAMENPDPQVQAMWASVPHKGEKPTPEEMLLYIVGQLEKPE